MEMMKRLLKTKEIDLSNLKIQEKIDAVIEKAIDEKQLVGASVGISYKQELSVLKGYGQADLNNKILATEHTVYRIGSMTKQFTALAIIMLVEQGKCSLDDNMLCYLPDYPVKEHKVTIEQLLNHTSGIKSMTDIEKFWEMSQHDLSRQEMVELFGSEPVDFLPGEKFWYNNSGYYLLGMIIENISGLSYADFLRKNVWEHLEMFDTHYLGSAKCVNYLATGYDLKENEFVDAAPLGMENPFAGGALGSNVVDLLKWQSALQHYQLISASSYQKMVRAGILNDGKRTTYGFGFFLSNLDGRRKIDHGGDINGFRTHLSYYPDDDLSVVVLCNLGSAPRAQLESRIARLVLGIPEIEIEEILLSDDELDIYTGSYKWCWAMVSAPFAVSVIEGRLHIGKRISKAIGDCRFVFEDDLYANIIFVVEKGKAVSFRIEREGQEIEAVRIEDS